MKSASYLEETVCHNLFFSGKELTKCLLVKLGSRSDANGIFSFFYAYEAKLFVYHGLLGICFFHGCFFCNTTSTYVLDSRY
jgi:hypothetical protein